jgi:hypothetical protein
MLGLTACTNNEDTPMNTPEVSTTPYTPVLRDPVISDLSSPQEIILSQGKTQRIYFGPANQFGFELRTNDKKVISSPHIYFQARFDSRELSDKELIYHFTDPDIGTKTSIVFWQGHLSWLPKTGQVVKVENCS